MSNLLDHARKELAISGIGNTNSQDEYNLLIHDAVIEIIHLFSKQGHSGMSAGIVTSIVEKLMKFQPLSPLTGEDSEWNHIGKNLYQNNRCSHVFKENEKAYDIHGKVFVNQHGVSFTSSDSRVPVVFPYTPKTEYINVVE